MSMQIDYTKPLGDVEQRYLAERGQQADIDRARALTGSEELDLGSGDGTGPQMRPLGTAEQRALQREQLQAQLAALDAAESETLDADDEADAEVDGYETWTVPELDKELKRRNLSTSGTKPEKANRLYNDDEQAAAPAE